MLPTRLRLLIALMTWCLSLGIRGAGNGSSAGRSGNVLNLSTREELFLVGEWVGQVVGQLPNRST